MYACMYEQGFYSSSAYTKNKMATKEMLFAFSAAAMQRQNPLVSKELGSYSNENPFQKVFLRQDAK